MEEMHNKTEKGPWSVAILAQAILAQVSTFFTYRGAVCV